MCAFVVKQFLMRPYMHGDSYAALDGDFGPMSFRDATAYVRLVAPSMAATHFIVSSAPDA